MPERVELRRVANRAAARARAEAGGGGSWFRAKRAEGVPGPVLVLCPECRKAAMLSPSGHAVAKDGRVSPSLVCPSAGCTWHVWATLAGWEGVL